LCTAEYFANDGAKLILTDIKEDALAEAKQKLLAQGATSVDTFVVDVSKQDQVDRMAAAVLRAHGRLDVLINNAGVGYMGEIFDTPIAKWRQLVDVNLWGPLYHIYAFLPSMIAAGGGHIANISSGQVFYQLPTWGPYAAVKAALGVMSEILHWEMRKYHIKVTTVYPYMVNTGFYHGIQSDSVVGQLSMKLMPYYSHSPEKVAKIIYQAIRREKHVELVTVINTFGQAMRFFSPIGDSVSFVADLMLGKKKSAGQAKSAD
jgi:short-subunit dehydrogenase